MKHILNNLSDEEKNSILEQHIGGKELFIENFNTLTNNKLGNVKPLISEDNLQGGGQRGGGSKQGTGFYQDTVAFDKNVKYLFGKDKMKTGSDEVDTNNSQYKSLITKLKESLINSDVKGPIQITVTGGASKVGSSAGYNNQRLAERRAEKFIAQLKKDVPGLDKKFKLTPIGVVGRETKLNSPDAYKEQFVNVSFSEPSKGYIKTPVEVDNTTVDVPTIYPPVKKNVVKDKKDGDEDFDQIKMKRVCVQIPETYIDEYLQMIKKFNTENSLPKVKYGVYDIIVK